MQRRKSEFDLSQAVAEYRDSKDSPKNADAPQDLKKDGLPKIVSDNKEEKKDALETKRSPPTTVFIFGATSGRQSKKGKSIISQFCEYCEDKENTFVYDGVGDKRKNNPRLNAVLGIFSKESDATVKQVLDDILKKTPLPTQLNMMGFSHGAVELIQVANLLYEKNPNIKVRLFLIDPVAGPTKKGSSNRQRINKNVTDCVVLLSKNETRKYMSVQDPIRRLKVMDPKSTSLHALPLPGRHDECDYQMEGHKTNSVPETAWQLAYQFLKKGGTKFKDNKIPPMLLRKKDNSFIEMEVKEQTASERLYVYNKMRANAAEFTDTATGFYTKKRSFLRYLDLLVADEFMNQDERELCKYCYPLAFNYLFEGAVGFDHKNNQYKMEVVADLAKMQREHLEIFKMINQRIPILDRDFMVKIPDQPSGMRLEEKMTFNAGMSVADKTMHNLPHLLKAICKPYAATSLVHEVKGIQLANAIMKQVDVIMSDDKDNKNKRIIEQVKILIQAGKSEKMNRKLIDDVEFLLENQKPLERNKNFRIGS